MFAIVGRDFCGDLASSLIGLRYPLTWPTDPRGGTVLKKYYRAEMLASDLARTTFLFPDRSLELDQGSSADGRPP